jgi:hypothetical protein
MQMALKKSCINRKDTTQKGNKINKNRKERYVLELSSCWTPLGQISDTWNGVFLRFFLSYT